jgi:hypothetical protein
MAGGRERESGENGAKMGGRGETLVWGGKREKDAGEGAVDGWSDWRDSVGISRSRKKKRR